MLRKIIHIDEDKCNGCGLCVPNCPEGAIQMIDGKARLVSDLFCDGLGACLGECPEGAIHIEEREAEPYDEERVMENVIRQGASVIRAHLTHLHDHGETEHYATAVALLQKKGLPVPSSQKTSTSTSQGCPGSRVISFEKPAAETQSTPKPFSALSTWPVQLHLLPPRAAFFKDKDLVLAADCVAYACGDFHSRFLKGKTLAIACPKLDEGQEIYLEKLQTIIAEGGIRSLTVLTMEVPCCSGLAGLLQQALKNSAATNVKADWLVISLKGDIIKQTEIR